MKQTSSALLLLLWALTLPTTQARESMSSITTAPLGELLFHPEYSAPATTLSLNNSRISAETAGRIRQIPVKVGDQVAKDDLLVELECRDNRLRRRQAESILKGAEARLTLARRQRERTQSLRKDRNVSEELLNQREADVRTAAAERMNRIAALEKAQLDEARCQVRAPFSGIVMERLAGEGEWVNIGQPLVQLLDNQRLEVSAQVPVNRVDSLRNALAPRFESDHRYPLRLRRILPVVETRGRYREARLEFSAAKALPGSAGRLVWSSSAAVLPADLIERRGDTLGVFLLRAGKARFHPLPDALEGQPARVDLPTESLLIIEGRQGLSDGDPVVVRQ